MTLDEFRNICLAFPDTTEELPFGPGALVFKVKGKMFALASLDPFESVNLKCDPENAIDLRERYPAVQPGYHMNKKHWNTILMNHTISDKLIREWVSDSYQLVRSGLPKNLR